MRSFIVIVVAAGPAFAQPSEPTLAKPSDPEAARLYRDGNGHYKVREYDQAIASYAASIKIEESQAALYNIAQSHRQLGHYEDAIWFYRRLIDSASLTGAPREQVEQLIGAMRSELDKRAKSQPPLGVATVAEPTRAVVAQAEPMAELEDEPPATPRWYHDWRGWTVTGGGVALGGAAVALAMSGEHAQRDANTQPDELARERLQARADSRRTWAAITGIAGGAIAAAGIVVLALPPSDADIVVALGAGGVTVAGRF